MVGEVAPIRCMHRAEVPGRHEYACPGHHVAAQATPITLPAGAGQMHEMELRSADGRTTGSGLCSCSSSSPLQRGSRSRRNWLLVLLGKRYHELR